MSDYMISTVGKVDLAANSQAVVAAAQQHTASKPSAAEAPAPKEAAPKPKVSNAMDLKLKFEIDSKTNDVTIFIIDRASDKVVRTIPPEEISKLDPGELLEMTA